MTYLGMDSFDNGTLRLASTEISNAVNVTIQAAGHTGTYALRIEDSGHWLRREVTGTPANLSVGVWIDPDANWNDDDGIRLRLQLTSGEYIDFRWDGVAHSFDSYVDGVKVADGLVAVPANAYFNFQVHVFVDNAGFIKTAINDVVDTDYTGDTLPAGATAQIEYIYLYNGDTGYIYFDDFIWQTADWVGDCRIRYLVPDADTAVHDWTPSAGPASFQDVDEVPASDVDYIESNADGDEEELDITDTVGPFTEIVLVSSIARLSAETGGLSSIDVGVDSGGVDDVTRFLAETTWAYGEHFMPLNPNGSIAWVQAAIDALKARVESVI